MFTKVLYAAILYLLISYAEDKGKAKLALKKAWRSFGSILPSEPAILLCGFILTFLNLQTISRLLGADSRALGMVIAAAVGCAALIPGFAAFPLAASLLAARQADDA